MGVVQLIPASTSIAAAAASSTYKTQIRGTAQLALQFLVAGADAAPKITIHGSNDQTNWDAYEVSAGVTALPLVTAGTKSVVRDTFPHEYIKVTVDVNGGSAGTISCKLNIKEQTV